MDFFQILHRYAMWVKEEPIKIWRSKVKGEGHGDVKTGKMRLFTTLLNKLQMDFFQIRCRYAPRVKEEAIKIWRS